MFSGEPFGGLIPGAQGAVLSALLRAGTPLTGRQVHRLVGDQGSQQTAQRALNVLTQLGLVERQPAGRAYLYTVNENHVAIPPLRELSSPIGMLRSIVSDALGNAAADDVVAVVLFGSIARGEATRDSDVDLTVLARPGWDGRAELATAVEVRYGSPCDVLLYTPDEYVAWVKSGEEPVLRTVHREGLCLWGTVPRVRIPRVERVSG